MARANVDQVHSVSDCPEPCVCINPCSSQLPGGLSAPPFTGGERSPLRVRGPSAAVSCLTDFRSSHAKLGEKSNSVVLLPLKHAIILKTITYRTLSYDIGKQTVISLFSS